MPETKATLRYLRTSPYKVREVLGLIRGLEVSEAQRVLRFSDRGAARDVLKVLNSAVANADHTLNLPADELYVSVAFADEGPTIKRWRPRARGRATRIRKRTCHITVTVARLTDEQLQARRRREAAGVPGGRRRGVLPGRRRRGEEGAAKEPAPARGRRRGAEPKPAAVEEEAPEEASLSEVEPGPPAAEAAEVEAAEVEAEAGAVEAEPSPPAVEAEDSPPAVEAEDSPPAVEAEDSPPAGEAEDSEDAEARAARYATLGRHDEPEPAPEADTEGQEGEGPKEEG
jgi:large subunit ribosomal protein L22